MKSTDLHVKILLLKCKSPFLKILVLENQCKIMVPLFGAAQAAPNKGTTIFFTDLGLKKQGLKPLANSRIQGLFKAFECAYSTFQGIFFKDFSRQSCIFKYFSSLYKP